MGVGVYTLSGFRHLLQKGLAGMGAAEGPEEGLTRASALVAGVLGSFASSITCPLCHLGQIPFLCKIQFLLMMTGFTYRRQSCCADRLCEAPVAPPGGRQVGA